MTLTRKIRNEMYRAMGFTNDVNVSNAGARLQGQNIISPNQRGHVCKPLLRRDARKVVDVVKVLRKYTFNPRSGHCDTQASCSYAEYDKAGGHHPHKHDC